MFTILSSKKCKVCKKLKLLKKVDVILALIDYLVILEFYNVSFGGL